MRCDVCGEQTAVIQVQEIVAGEQTSLKLCAQCAATQDYRFSSVAGGTMRKLLESVSELAAKLSDSQGEAATCPECGLDDGTFRNTGLVGCPNCYLALKDQIAHLYPHLADQLSPSAQEPQETAESFDPPARIQPTLAQQLNRAVIEERYEDAAKLRDQIQHQQSDVSQQ